MRAIDADSLEREGWTLHRTYPKDKNTMIYEVKKPSEMPAIEPEIVRCEDCKHYRQHDDQDDLCVYTMTSVEADDYCSHAERREG